MVHIAKFGPLEPFGRILFGFSFSPVGTNDSYIPFFLVEFISHQKSGQQQKWNQIETPLS